ncbi:MULTISPECIES: aminotransferase class V-fold PLP-dependent enzyme [unclassified Streptomyces]|uniref:aminotransferase class V-fold PLP-dependent enzyme n=1 Tax=unclassified Streptomyces TaxID=2593676 RepID=UPI0033AB2C5E
MTAIQDELSKMASTEFPLTRERTYLDAACIGVASQRTVDAVTHFTERTQWIPADSGTAHHGELNTARDAARPRAARLIGAQPQDIALVESATHGLSIAAQALPLKPGDTVALADLEYIQMGVTWSQLARSGIGIRRVPHTAGEVSVDVLRACLDDDVAVLALSSVQWTNGFRADLAAVSEMCRSRGIWLVVDAAQHIGALPFDVSATPVDILVCSGHKWLNSPFGTGFLYLAPEIRERLHRPMSGFFAAEPPADTWGMAFLRPDISPFQDFTYTGDARAWEIGGTSNYPGGIALASALDLVIEVGPPVMADHIFALTDHLLAGLDRLGLVVVTPRRRRHRSGIVTFTLGTSTADTALMNYLGGAGVAVSVRYTAGVGGIRVSCHWFNSPADVGLLLDVVGHFTRS